MYKPSKGIFVNGRIAEAVDLVNEFAAIATGITETDAKVISEANKAEVEAKAYTDTAIGSLTVDGGTF